ncbi:DUF1189 family protein [Candidatus Woesearchaeota archaeon]|nr:DUF1189 family protein [Candidatus Woesearchaeota archaeon]
MFKVGKSKTEARKHIHRAGQKIAENHFFRTFFHAFNPMLYRELANRPCKKVVSYYLSLIFIVFIIVTLIALPQIIGMSSFLQDQISHFSEFSVDITQKMDSPIILPEKDSMFILDTAGTIDISGYSTPFMYITNKEIMTRCWFRENHIMLDDYSDVAGNSQRISSLLTTVLILMLPSLIFFAYMFFALKYLIIILIASLLVFILIRLLKFEIYYKEVLKVGFYASTVMVVVEIVGKILFSRTYFVHYALFLLFYIIGALKAGDVEVHQSRQVRKFSFRHKDD